MSWNQEQAPVLRAIIDQLIPANVARGIPGAGEIGVADYLESVCTRDDDLDASITALLGLAGLSAEAITPALVGDLEAKLPGPFAQLLAETYKGYYSRADMRAKVGIAAHPVHPAGYIVARERPELMAELTAPVRARGPVFRDPTGGQE